MKSLAPSSFFTQFLLMNTALRRVLNAIILKNTKSSKFSPINYAPNSNTSLIIQKVWRIHPDLENDLENARKTFDPLYRLYLHDRSSRRSHKGKLQYTLITQPTKYTNLYITICSAILALRPNGVHGALILDVSTGVGTLIVATIYLQLIQNRYMFRSFTVLQCRHQHCVQPVASDVEVAGYL